MSATTRAYLELTKPGITLFIGITAAAGFITAAGWAMPMRFVATVTATMLMSAGAATLNQVAEHRWDALMRRTSMRPLPAGTINPTAARVFAGILTGSGLAISLLFLNVSAAVFLVLCHISYVHAYTPLKRRTPLCTLVGAIPGALPVLAGWTAAGKPIDTAAIALTGVLFMWQIPHFLAIGWMARDDYRTAGCPMLGVVEPSGLASARVSLVYAVATLLCALVLGVAISAGPLFLVAAVLTGGAYIHYAVRFVREPARPPARRLFFCSLAVLPLLLSALMLDLL